MICAWTSHGDELAISSGGERKARVPPPPPSLSLPPGLIKFSSGHLLSGRAVFRDGIKYVYCKLAFHFEEIGYILETRWLVLSLTRNISELSFEIDWRGLNSSSHPSLHDIKKKKKKYSVPFEKLRVIFNSWEAVSFHCVQKINSSSFVSWTPCTVKRQLYPRQEENR